MGTPLRVCFGTGTGPPHPGVVKTREVESPHGHEDPQVRWTDSEREERRQAERKLLTDAVTQLKTSEGWTRWLRIRRCFHSYCFVVWGDAVT